MVRASEIAPLLHTYAKQAADPRHRHKAAVQAFNAVPHNMKGMILLVAAFGINKDSFLAERPITAEEFAEKYVAGFYSDKSAGTSARPLQDCFIVAMSTGMAKGALAKYGKNVDNTIFHSVLVSRCGEKFKTFLETGLFVANAFQAWNGPQGQGQTVTLLGEEALQLVVLGYTTDDFERTLLVLSALSNAGSKSSSILTWTKDRKGYHAISPQCVDLTRPDHITAFDHGNWAGGLQNIQRNNFVKLVVFDVIAYSRKGDELGEELECSPDYASAMDKVRENCQALVPTVEPLCRATASKTSEANSALEKRAMKLASEGKRAKKKARIGS